MIAFRGTFEHTLDVKHRLTIPAKCRATLANGVVLAASPRDGEGRAPLDRDLDSRGYDEYTSATLAGLNPMSSTARDLKRFSSASPMTPSSTPPTA